MLIEVVVNSKPNIPSYGNPNSRVYPLQGEMEMINTRHIIHFERHMDNAVSVEVEGMGNFILMYSYDEFRSMVKGS